MTLRTAFRFIAVTAIIGVPSLALAQLPDRSSTPGATGKVTEAQVCAPDFPPASAPSKWQREEALHRYGRRPEAADELDHLIPLSLGGTNDPDNLWPRPTNREMGADQKKELEVKLHEMVCSKALTLKAAQEAIRKDWIKAYGQYVTGAK
jgi:hypothetical protein